MMTCRIGWFSTGRDEAARDLLKTVQTSIEKGELEAGLCFVFSNREPGESRESDLFFELVNCYRIPLVYLSHRRFKAQGGHDWRREYDREVMKELEGYHPQICLLAGYMLIVGGELCQRYSMINLHPAAPGGPVGTWQEVIWKLIEARAVESGVMMHLVTPELDKGPPVTYCTFSLRGEPFDKYWEEIETRSLEEVKLREGERNALFSLIRQQELAREFPLIVATLKAFTEGGVKIDAGKILDAQGKPIKGYDLTQEIEKAI